jgi:hypothetical protein
MTGTTAWLDFPAARSGGAMAVQAKGALGEFDVVHDRLVAGQSGVHRYDVVGQARFVLQAKVATEAFDPILVVMGPDHNRWELSSAPSHGLELPVAGAYALFVTSRENVTAGRAVGSGEYRLTLLCDAPPPATAATGRKTALAPVNVPAPPSSRSGRFSDWESEPR